MKKITTLLLALIATTGVAQDALRTQLDLVFANIDKSQIPTGFLEEYGASLVPLDVFNGVLSDSNKVDLNAWRQVYATLYSAHIYGTNPLSPLASVNQSILSNEDNYNARTYAAAPSAAPPNSALPVVMLYGNYNSLRPDAVSANLLSVDTDQLYDVAGRTESPYLTRTVFAATPVIDYARTGTVSIVFKPELFYNTSGKTVNYIQVDWNDGNGYQNASWNTPVTASYTVTGTKTIKIKVLFSDASVAECYSILDIMEVAEPQVRYGTPNQEIVFNATANHAGARVTVEFDVNDAERTLNRPLIVIEGYDVSSIAPTLQENYDVDDFFNAINRIRNTYDFNQQLDNVAGYDLVFIDYNYGTDDIRRNAALVQEVIAWVNDQKAAVGSTEQNVVLGLSMGGLVGRFALANMTKQGINPQTRLLITHDSPHRGANTPLGFQFLTRQLNDITLVSLLNLFDLIPQLEQANDVLDEPATQQLLIVRATDGNGGTSTNTFLDGDYRTMITFNPTDPQPAYRIVATSLGSECGQQNLTPHTELLRTTGKFFLSPVPWIVRTSYNVEAIVNALPNTGESKQLSKIRIWYSKRILMFITINIDLTNKSANSPTNLLAWDGAPGGTQNVADQVSSIPSANYKFLPFFNLTLGTTYFDGGFCFVPTVSALDVTTLNQASLSAVYEGGISPTNPARVDNFIAQERVGGSTTFNETHIRFTARNAEWIFNEMQSITNTLNCAAECDTSYGNISILGSSTVCTNEQFSVANQPAGTTVTWSSSNSSGLVIDASTGVSTVQSNFYGEVTLTANVTSACGSASLQKTVWAGVPDWPGYLTVTGGSFNDMCVRSQVQVMINAVPGAASYSWTSDNPTGLQVEGNGLGALITGLSPSEPDYWTFTYASVNACGSNSASYGVIINDCRSNEPLVRISSDGADDEQPINDGTKSNVLPINREEIEVKSDVVASNIPFPNPVKHVLNVKVEEKSVLALLNMNGQEVRSMQGQGKVSIYTTDLPDGFYVLSISNGKTFIRHKVIVRH